ncbi:MAG: hypothetical protein ABIT01_10020 [Thermoanaerobaculia bacterium]
MAAAPKIAKSMSAADIDETKRYLKVSFAAEAAIEDAMALLEARQPLAAEDERATILSELARLQDQFFELLAERAVFLNGKSTITPPTEQEVQAVMAGIAELSKAISNAETTQKIVSVTEALLDVWREAHT